ncbi:ATP-dependent DNA helicase RecG [Flaviflexus equikiangi]|uniref:Probable DNA 3'-5' helicase RecG n=1 Tax=Flaviflexus equikiangi TaxID=2758573 RepID=A0ABS2TDX6_9ACTO|nr:ATP-dependent DNA helicase RecG [Flaviflexus equikiangi]MBM9432863.1 ATP-dependent DNA helicase RecG [Flaviflexus equikiangi]
MEAVATDGRTLLESPLDRVLGARTAKALSRLGLETVSDLLNHAPRRYVRRGELVPLSHAHEGDSVTVVATVLGTSMRPMNARRGFLLKVMISDGNVDMSLTFFAKSSRPLAFHEMKLKPGTVATFSGTVSSYRGELQLTHPEYEVLEDGGDVDKDEIARPRPLYPSAVNVPTWTIEKAIATILDQVQPADIPEPLPESFRTRHGLLGAYDALMGLHRPGLDADWQRARERMKFEEALILQTVLIQRGHEAAAVDSTPRPARPDGLAAAFDARLPFELTEGQRLVGDQISADLASSRPMTRLLQGDVGSGKTIVALRAMLQVVDGGGQAALLAPTEVLAEQHFRSITSMLGELALGGLLSDLGTRVDLLTGTMGAKATREVLGRVAGGETGIIIGTHALLSDRVQIPFLSLAIVDEQHRFGVDQREALRARPGVNLLVMTATPIPRTLAMTAFGDLAVSELTELPRGRGDVTTTIVPAGKTSWVDRVWERVAEDVTAGGRAFVVCPRIDPDDEATGLESSDENPRPPLSSVVDTADQLRRNPALAGITIGTLTGPMSPEDKTSIMAAFQDGTAPVLVATTVIEVGVDVPDATTMIILDADRFGLSQLHQLRGRIGRGTKPGLCLALSWAPEGTIAAERLAAFADTRDGFALAERDMELRREGDVLGASQSGAHSHLRHLEIRKDVRVIEMARDDAIELVAQAPDLSPWPGLRDAVNAARRRSEIDYLGRN